MSASATSMMAAVVDFMFLRTQEQVQEKSNKRQGSRVFLRWIGMVWLRRVAECCPTFMDG